MNLKNISSTSKSIIIGMWRSGANHDQIHEITGFSELNIQKILSSYRRSQKFKETVILDVQRESVYKLNQGHLQKNEIVSDGKIITDFQAVKLILEYLNFDYEDFNSPHNKTEEYAFVRHSIIHILRKNGLQSKRIGELMNRDSSLASKSEKAIVKLLNSEHKRFLYVYNKIIDLIGDKKIITPKNEIK